MKKVLFACALTIASFTALSQAKAATLLLRGEIATACTLNAIDTSAFPGASVNLPIVSGTTSTSVAKASVSCNNTGGYAIKASSANGFSRMSNTSNASSYVNYELELTGTGTTGFQALSGAPVTLKSAPLGAPINNELSTLNIRMYPIATPVAAGAYEDTVTITLTAL